MSAVQTTIAVLDDESQMRKALSRLLRSHGYSVRTYADGEELLAAAVAARHDCLILDLHMPGMTGFDVLSVLASRSPSPPVIVITGHDSPGTAERVLSGGASAYLLKPVDEAVLVEAIHRATVPMAPADTPE